MVERHAILDFLSPFWASHDTVWDLFIQWFIAHNYAYCERITCLFKILFWDWLDSRNHWMKFHLCCSYSNNVKLADRIIIITPIWTCSWLLSWKILNSDIFGASIINGHQIRKLNGKILRCGLFNLASGYCNQDMKIWCTPEDEADLNIIRHVASVLLSLMRKYGSLGSCFNKRQSLNINFYHAAMYQNHNDGQIILCEENMKSEIE